jgi:glycosyltransferase 2 family protein
MPKSAKIIVGILFSAFLFYLFIKDVNKIPLISDSGRQAGSGSDLDRILYVQENSGFEIGSKIEVFDPAAKASEIRKVASIKNPPESPFPALVVDAPLEHNYRLAAKPYIKFPRLESALKNAKYIWLVPSFLFTMLALMIRAYRWRFFFPDYKKLPWNSLWVAVCIGYMANNVLPFRMGEIIRAWILSRKEKRKISESFGTIVTERIFDILSILIVFVLFTLYFTTRPDVKLPGWLKEGAWVLSLVSVASLIFLIFLRFKTSAALKLIQRMTRPLPGRIADAINHFMGSFVQGLGIFSDFRAASMAFLISMIIWLDLAVAYYFIFLAVNIDATLLIAIFLIVGLAGAVSLPSAPGFIGTFHIVGKEVLLMMGLKGNIEAYVLLAHAMAYVPIVIIGLVYLSLENLSFKELRNSIKYQESIEDESVAK